MIDESLVETRIKQKKIGIGVLCQYSLDVDLFVILKRSWHMVDYKRAEESTSKKGYEFLMNGNISIHYVAL